jgi:hypothetical protein
MKKENLKLTKEVQDAIIALRDEDSKLRYPEVLELNNEQVQNCIKLGLCDKQGMYKLDLSDEIWDFINETLG